MAGELCEGGEVPDADNSDNKSEIEPEITESTEKSVVRRNPLSGELLRRQPARKSPENYPTDNCPEVEPAKNISEPMAIGDYEAGGDQGERRSGKPAAAHRLEAENCQKRTGDRHRSRRKRAVAGVARNGRNSWM